MWVIVTIVRVSGSLLLIVGYGVRGVFGWRRNTGCEDCWSNCCNGEGWEDQWKKESQRETRRLDAFEKSWTDLCKYLLLRDIYFKCLIIHRVLSFPYCRLGLWSCWSYYWQPYQLVTPLNLPSPRLRQYFLPELLHVIISKPSTFLTANISAQIAQEQPPAPPPTLDEVDVTRHREITSKAVSAILLLILKWFKVSRKPYFFICSYWHANWSPQDVMKFHELACVLLDTNCLLLILKMFGMQEVSASVVSKADSPENKYMPSLRSWCRLLITL